MAVVDDRQGGCDGCGRTVPLEELTAITMPDGDRVACCPRCEPHAREAARKCSSIDQRRRTCDGCTDTILASRVEDVVLEDGTVLTCCPTCVAQAPAADSKTTSASSEADESTHTADDTRTRGHAESTDEDETLCTQCNEWVTAERFEITTIDGRSERFCPPCTETAKENGIVKTIGMRKSEAREVLSVDPAASDEEIRAAFHREVKRAHPDRKSGSRSAFQLVTDAYERLQKDA
ncbi:J domain-containing protein [Natronorubrum daqingense]|uniref:DnaJ domain-containing protein n=1 Tax=Natronorubrum daqingense TaxID=588898 RepID=A0A1N7DNE0_9EURY|nr:J domain-containing protein [Natronorubrum daqingense]APX96078.1 molecular chaperone DnaJ [Natronorubrum daqingense]SIR77337.1 DnaJ domain-containing protein [Natronorubrum daqingense]